MGKFSFKDLGLILILSLTMVTLLSWMLSQYTDFPQLKSGGAFVMLMVVTFLIYLFVVARDGKIDKGEILTIFIVAVSLLVSGIMLKKFMPEIFMALPDATKQFFSAFA